MTTRSSPFHSHLNPSLSSPPSQCVRGGTIVIVWSPIHPLVQPTAPTPIHPTCLSLPTDHRFSLFSQHQFNPITTSTAQSTASSPHSGSPFAFAPRPLSSTSRPILPMHHSDPIPHASFTYYPKSTIASHHSPYSFPATSASMAYRSYSNDASTQRPSSQTTDLTRTPSMSVMASPAPMHAQASPSISMGSSPYAYQRPIPTTNTYQVPSPRGTSIYPNQYYPLQATDMPRSLSYPSFVQPYPPPAPGYHPSMSTPSLHQPLLPSLSRHNTVSGMNEGTSTEIARPNMGYSCANRLPLVERPFKCDECVQSFVHWSLNGVDVNADGL